MNIYPNLHLARLRALLAAVTMAAGTAIAAPGAHGPGGEHLDAPAAPAEQQARPRMEAATDVYELVAELAGGELSMLIDKFETNEPVNGAQVEVEVGGLKAAARFHADHGDYAVDDAAMIKLLMQPGEHALVILVNAGGNADLLNGTLVVPPGTALHDDHGHGHALEYGLAAGAAGLLIVAWWLRRRRRHALIAGSAS